MAIDRKYRKALALCLTSEQLPNAANSRDELRLDSNDVTRVTQVTVLRRKRVFFLEKCVPTAAKTMVVGRKNQKALALLGLASGPLLNAVNSSVVPSDFAAEPAELNRQL